MTPALATPTRYRHSGEGRNPAVPKAICSCTGALDSFALSRAAGFRVCASLRPE